MKKPKSGDGDLIVSETADGDQDSVSAGLGLGHHEWVGSISSRVWWCGVTGVAGDSVADTGCYDGCGRRA